MRKGNQNATSPTKAQYAEIGVSEKERGISLFPKQLQYASCLSALQRKYLPVIFGEIAPLNTGVLMGIKQFFKNVYNRGLSVCGWLWKYDGNDTKALLHLGGLPNNNNNRVADNKCLAGTGCNLKNKNGKKCSPG